MLEYITDNQRALVGGFQLDDSPESFAVGTDLKGAEISTLNVVAKVENTVVGDCCEDLGVCELGLAEAEAENELLQDANDALNLAAEENESIGSEGNRISVATHIFDYANATVIQTDIWKYELWMGMSVGNPWMIFRFRKAAISRDPNPGFPEQSGIRFVRPDEVTGDDDDFIDHLASFSGGNLNVGDVWTFQYVFEDASNYIGDPNIINTGYIDVFTVTIIKDISTGFVAGETYVRIEVQEIGQTYDTKSGLPKP
ncbi:hypothetical protein DRO66_02325 [Candidatus Bathyarchaeota archaeon]|nr:MAG: hypothetical protein DRO66_02325 [Candidatus Bathyarchaeota archaeon]